MIENISAVIITKNASQTIKTTLESLKDFKEIIVFDSGSIDGTIDIAQIFNNVVMYQGEFFGFGQTKNHAIHLASNDWIFSLDADESLSKELALHLNDIDLQSKLVGEVQRKNFFMGKEMTTAGWGRDKIIRLFNRKEFCFSDLQVHEKVEIDSSAKKVFLNGSLIHLAINNLSETLEKANLYSDLYAKENDTSYPIMIIIIKAQYAFVRTYFLQRGFLAGWRGFVLAVSNSVGVFYKYIKIYAKQKIKK
jgi:glycosyltransferase involved in cell wall biosynthesis|nr:glycosyltransferase family 2 protein [Pelagibacteraceae bacterium]